MSLQIKPSYTQRLARGYAPAIASFEKRNPSGSSSAMPLHSPSVLAGPLVPADEAPLLVPADAAPLLPADAGARRGVVFFRVLEGL